jgi:hypothetical protein
MTIRNAFKGCAIALAIVLPAQAQTPELSKAQKDAIFSMSSMMFAERNCLSIRVDAALLGKTAKMVLALVSPEEAIGQSNTDNSVLLLLQKRHGVAGVCDFIFERYEETGALTHLGTIDEEGVQSSRFRA